MNKKNDKSFLGFGIFVVVLVLFIIFTSKDAEKEEYENYSSNVFSFIASSENEVFDSALKDFAKKEDFKINIQYDDTLKITRRLNQGEKFDAVWLSNSIWMYAVDSSKTSISNTKSTSINPIVFGIRKSKAESLGFVGKDIYTKDIVDAVKNGDLKFSMSNPVTTNSGASAYLGILSTLAGNPEVLTKEMLENSELKSELKSFFSGVERSSGDESYLEDMFVKGDYEAVFTYESSIININKKMKNKDVLYAIYPIDGVSISDSPIGYIDQKDDYKKEIYDKLVGFLLGNSGQKLLADYGRRTWYGGVTDKADKKTFNPNWGIDTKTYISSLKYPSTSVINQALALYQSSLRKPIHVVFCLDYSGSMYGDGFDQLVDAMDYILTDRAREDLLQFTDEDIVEVIPFSDKAYSPWKATNMEERQILLDKINNNSPAGMTALFPAAEKALELLRNEDRNTYNTSVILMTDGAGNVGYYEDTEKYYKSLKLDIPIYSIKFASADEYQLRQLANLTNGKVFDGSTSLVDAFMEVRGYN